jgi:hypothetical protein
MCPNCERETKTISVSKGWCESCMKAYKEGVRYGEQVGYSEGFGEASAEADF